MSLYNDVLNTNSYQKAQASVDYYKLSDEAKTSLRVNQITDYVIDKRDLRLRMQCMQNCDANSVPGTILHADCIEDCKKIEY